MKQIKKAALAACTTLLLSYGAYAQSWPSAAPTLNDGMHAVLMGGPYSPLAMDAINSDMMLTTNGYVQATIYERYIGPMAAGNPELYFRYINSSGSGLDSAVLALAPGATHPDVVLLNFPTSTCSFFYVGVVYEYNGDTWFELCAATNVGSGSMSLSSVSSLTLTADPANHLDSRWPHIDAFPEPSGTSICTGSNMWKMAITWSEDIGSGYNIYASYADINASFPPAFTPAQFIDQGYASDVAAVTDMNASGNPQIAYFIYNDRSQSTINRADWDVSTTTVNTYSMIESGTFSHCPRIEAQNLGASSSSRILWEAVAQVNKTGLEEVHAYGYNTASGMVSTDNYAASLSPINTYNHYMPAVSTGQGANNTLNSRALGNNSFTIGWYMGTDNNIQALQLSNDIPSTVLTGFSRVNKFTIGSGPAPVCGFTSCSNTGDYIGSVWHTNDVIGSYDNIGLKTSLTSFAFKTTGVNNATSNGTSYLYPNPAKDVISVFSAEDASYTITDMMGRSLQTGKFSSKNNTVDISALTPGMYILALDKGDIRQNIKFAKE